MKIATDPGPQGGSLENVAVRVYFIIMQKPYGNFYQKKVVCSHKSLDLINGNVIQKNRIIGYI
jgi:hypothetical protein